MRLRAHKDIYEGEIMTDKLTDSFENLRIKIAAARDALNQAWEKFGEFNDFVLEAADHFDRLMNEYGRLVRRNPFNG
jgi:hypothetical protein